MAKIVISTIGTRGDLNPFLSLAFRLRTRGHNVLFAVEESFRPPLIEANFAVHHLTGDIQVSLMPFIHQLIGRATPLPSLKILVEKWILPTIHTKVEELYTACSDADLLIAHTIQLAAPIVAELTGIPWVHVTMTPLNVPSVHVSPHLFPLWLPDNLPPIINRAMWAMMAAALRHIIDKPINRIRIEYGLAPGHDLLGVGNHSRTLTAIAASPTFLPPPPDWPSYVRMTGFCFWDTSPNWCEPAELTAFLESPEPVVVASFGSMSPYVNDALARFYRTSIEAIQSLNVRALIIGAGPTIPLGPISERVLSIPFAPFSQIYSRCTVAIHHGGMSTTGEALRAGLPAIIVPWGIDQFFTAARIEHLGVGRQIHPHTYTPKKAAKILNTLLLETHYKTKTQALAAQLAREDGIATLCDAIEAILYR